MDRERVVSAALRLYAAMATSADTGAVRDLSLLERPGASATSGSDLRTAQRA